MSTASIPDWFRPALQGITYWIGHRRSIYRQYPLGEAAFVAELCNLIHAHLSKNYRLKCEVQFSKFLKGEAKSTVLTEKARADLVIARVTPRINKRDKLTPKHVVEIKRAKAPKSAITNDLKRLAAVRDHESSIRAYLVIVSEAGLPKAFVTSKGTAKSGAHKISNTTWYYRVRRVCKASASFKNVASANYACLLEVVSG